jgi:Isochorismatase family
LVTHLRHSRSLPPVDLSFEYGGPYLSLSDFGSRYLGYTHDLYATIHQGVWRNGSGVLCDAGNPGPGRDAPNLRKKKVQHDHRRVQERLQTIPQRDSYVVVGIEAHVCVQQTCLDLLRSSTVERPVDVYVVADGVSSQQPYDRAVALQRLVQAGATVTTAQSLVFELMGTADHPNFMAISKLTMAHMNLPNKFNDDFSNSVNK